MPGYPDSTLFQEYCDDRNIALPTLDNDQMSAALLVASETLDMRFGAMFSGVKTGGRAQERQWPRTGATDKTGYEFGPSEMPQEVLSATYELAVLEAFAPGSLMVNFTPSKYKSASVDGAVSVEWVANMLSAWDAQPDFHKVNLLIAPLLTAETAAGSLISGSSIRA